MKSALLWPAILLAAAPALAHMMSMSTGDAVVSGNHVEYVLRMPLYEIAHVKDPERALFDHIHFRSAGEPARMLEHTCHEDPATGSYLCAAYYEFSRPVESLEVDCTLHSVTVPNHVHLLRAEKGSKKDQAILDYTFPDATLRFRPPTPFEVAMEQGGAGAVRALGGLVQILFLAALALAARSRRELLALAGMFAIAQAATVLFAPRFGWQAPARFVEAAAALAVAYMAVEILFLPQAGMRWLVAGVLGIFPGLYLDLFLQNTGYKAAYVLTGAVIAELLLITVLAILFWSARRHAAILRPVPVAASAMLAVGMIWFFIRLRG